MEQNLILRVVVEEGASLPSYAYPTDSGADLYANESYWVWPFSRRLIGTGVRIKLPFKCEGQIRSKSGLANKGLFVLNSPGTIDNSYVGEIKVIIFNTNFYPYRVKKGQKIAQLVVSQYETCSFVLESAFMRLQKDSLERGDKGFGSTGLFDGKLRI